MLPQNLDNFKNFVYTMHYLNEPAVSATKAVIISLTILCSVFLIGFISYRCFMKYYGNNPKVSYEPLKEPFILKDDRPPEGKVSSEVRYEPQENRKPSEKVRKISESPQNLGEQARRENTSTATPTAPKKSNAQYPEINNQLSDTKVKQNPSQQATQQEYPEVNNPFTLTDEDEQT